MARRVLGRGSADGSRQARVTREAHPTAEAHVTLEARVAGETHAPRVHVGISGWRYPPWRRKFYPEGLAQRRELEYAAERFDSIEINGTFYSLQRPQNFQRWHDQTPENFRFAVKGPRYITHMLRMRNARVPLANFFASGVLALAEKLGPVLWQLPERQGFESSTLNDFLSMLPRDTRQAAQLATEHDARLDSRNDMNPRGDRVLRHALEVRSAEFATDEAAAMLRDHGVALVIAHSAGRRPILRETTADFAYLRLHGDQELYTSGYGSAALDEWAEEIRGLATGSVTPDGIGSDVYVYFDNDAKVHAPFDAMALRERLADLVARRS